jgi:hypothetical protein
MTVIATASGSDEHEKFHGGAKLARRVEYLLAGLRQAS